MLAAVHPTHRTPHVAIHVQAILGIVLALVLGFVTGGPLNAFALLGTVATIVMIAIYILTNLSCILYYLREQRDEFNALLHMVVPVLGILLFLPAEVAALGINFAGLGIIALTYPANDAPWVIVGWMVIGQNVGEVTSADGSLVGNAGCARRDDGIINLDLESNDNRFPGRDIADVHGRGEILGARVRVRNSAYRVTCRWNASFALSEETIH